MNMLRDCGMDSNSELDADRLGRRPRPAPLGGGFGGSELSPITLAARPSRGRFRNGDARVVC